MAYAPLLWGIDLSKRRTGIAYGCAGDTPAAMSIEASPDDPPRRAALRLYLAMHQLLKAGQPSVIYHERLIKGGFDPQINWEERSIKKRFGLQAQFDLIRMMAMLELLADLVTIPTREISPSTARKEFLGSGKLDRKTAKRRALSMCKLLGWPAANDDEADAMVIWHYGVCIEAPHLATPIHAGMHGRAATIAADLPPLFDPPKDIDDEVAW